MAYFQIAAQVGFQVGLLVEPFPAVGAHERALSSMNVLVFVEVTHVVEHFAALFALKHFGLAPMDRSQVVEVRPPAGKRLVATPS